MSESPTNSTSFAVLPPELRNRIIEQHLSVSPSDEAALRALSLTSRGLLGDHGSTAQDFVLSYYRYTSQDFDPERAKNIRWLSVRQGELTPFMNESAGGRDGLTAAQRSAQDRSRGSVAFLRSLSEQLPSLDGLVLKDENHHDSTSRDAPQSLVVLDPHVKGGVRRTNEDAPIEFGINTLDDGRIQATRDESNDYFSTYRFYDDDKPVSATIEDFKDLPAFHSMTFDTLDSNRPRNGTIDAGSSDMYLNLVRAQSESQESQPFTATEIGTDKLKPRDLKRLYLRTDSDPTELARSLQEYKFSGIDLALVPHYQNDTLDASTFPEEFWEELSRVEGVNPFKVKRSAVINQHGVKDMTDRLQEARRARWAAEDTSKGRQ